MIIISAGLPKSGSSLYFNMLNDLLIAAGHPDVRELKQQYRLEPVLKHHNCNIDAWNFTAARALFGLHARKKTFAVKTHSGPGAVARAFLYCGAARTACIYRDPRDVVVSAMDHGRRIREQGERHTFASCTTVEDTIPQVKRWLDNIMGWMEQAHVLPVTYEQLTGNPAGELQRLAEFLGIAGRVSAAQMENIVARYQRPEGDEFMKEYLHWNKGVAGRYRGVLSGQEQRQCDLQFRPYLQRLGYPLSTVG